MDEMIHASEVLGILYSAQAAMSMAVNITKDKDGNVDPEIWKVNLDLTRLVSKWSDAVSRLKREGGVK